MVSSLPFLHLSFAILHLISNHFFLFIFLIIGVKLHGVLGIFAEHIYKLIKKEPDDYRYHKPFKSGSSRIS